MKKLGDIGEDIATDFLKSNGYKIEDRNFRKRFGEIDIIASKKGILHFIEVKYRKDEGFGTAIEYVTKQKLEKILKTAKSYILENEYCEIDWRIDVLGIDPVSHEIIFIENVLEVSN